MFIFLKIQKKGLIKMENKETEITYIKMEEEINYYSSSSNEIRNKVAVDVKYLI